MTSIRAVVTGATKGIGRAIAEILAQQSYHLAICARNAAEVQATQAELAAQHPHIEIIAQAADLSQKEQTQAFARAITQQWPQVDLLVNNAGRYLPGTTLEEPEGNLEQLIATNLYSAYHLTRAIIPHMRQSPKAHVFNICSIASLAAYPNSGAYTISKFALLGLSKSLRHELLQDSIRVTAVMPGATWSSSWAGAPYPESRLMPAADIAQSILSTYQLSSSTVVEDIILRPQLGDL